jgi:hypothetical protein
LDIFITMRFSINCPTVFVYPLYAMFKGKASSEKYGPRVYLYHIFKSKNTLLQFIYLYFILCFYLSIYHYEI